MRVATGAICHETSTFTTVPTNWDSYKDRYGYLHGKEIIEKFRSTNTPMGGFIEAAEAYDFELIPTVYAEPQPSGRTVRDVFAAILDELLEGIRAAGEIDGVLLQLHGSMAAEGIDDADGYVLDKVREVVGPDLPVIAQLDIHSNVSRLMVDRADVIIGRETYPEVDRALRARECADVLVRIVREGLSPSMALHRIPMVWGTHQVTEHRPMSEAIAYLHEIEARPGVVCGSIATCFPAADVADMGASVYIVSDDDPALAQRYADELGEWIFARRADWHSPILSTRDALAQSDAEGRFPVIFADREDNTGGGTPGDSTGMLRTFLEADLKEACLLYMVDPESAEECHRVGVGETVQLRVGGKSSPLQGAPIELTAEVCAVSDGSFRYDGPMYEGLANTFGPSAHIRQGGVHVILVSLREQPLDMAFSRTLGLDPASMRHIGVKSTAHFRAAFEPIAKAIHLVAEPSVHNPAETRIAYHNLGRKLYPLDDI